MKWTGLGMIMLLFASTVYAQVPCNRVAMNLQGTANADITVDNTAGGILVADANPNRCSLLIENSGGTNTMLCAPQGVTPTGTVGKLVGPRTAATQVGGQLSLGEEATQAWRCFSTSGTTANVMESLR